MRPRIMLPILLTKPVDVMDEIIYNALSTYYDTLGKTGYLSSKESQKLLLLTFYRDFVFHDYRGLLSKEDYHEIEKALDCLWGSSCLMPYPDYLKMGKLHLGEVTEIAQRLKNLENEKVLKLTDADPEIESDILIISE